MSARSKYEGLLTVFLNEVKRETDWQPQDYHGRILEVLAEEKALTPVQISAKTLVPPAVASQATIQLLDIGALKRWSGEDGPPDLNDVYTLSYDFEKKLAQR